MPKERVMENAKDLRTLGIIAHVDAGKTTLSERILFLCKAIPVMGEVANGTAVMDFLPEEQKRGITIGSACISCFWKDKRLNLVDTPGHVDFTIEVDRILRVIDGALVVFSGVEGVESQSEMVWHEADDYGVARLVFINKLDRPEADFENVLLAMQARLNAKPLLLTMPTYRQRDGKRELTGVRDLISLTSLPFDAESRGLIQKREALSGEERDEAMLYRDELFETLAVLDDRFMAAWLEERVSPALCIETIRKLVRDGRIVPVFCGAAKPNIGIQPLLDAVFSLLPTPEETFLRVRGPNDDAPAFDQERDILGLIFKIVHTGDLRLAWMRLYQGTLTKGDTLTVSGKGNSKAAVRLFRLDAEQVHELEHADAGDIVAIEGLDCDTGDTVTRLGTPLFLESVRGLRPVLRQALETGALEDLNGLKTALARYRDEDPSLQVGIDEDTGRITLSGMGELHLAIVLERLGREYGLDVKAYPPCVLYKETLQESAEATADIVPDESTSRDGGHIRLALEPKRAGSGNSITLPELFPDASRDERLLWQTFLVESVQTLLAQGILGEGPLEDLACSILEVGPVNDICTQKGIHAALEKALHDALNKAGPFCIEPIMRLELHTPEDQLGNVLKSLKAVRGTVTELLEGDGQKCVHAFAPLTDLLDFPTRLRSATKGLCRLFMAFDHYAKRSGSKESR